MPKDPGMSGLNNFEVENVEIETEEENEIKWRFKLRITAIIIIVLCSSSMIISYFRRSALFRDREENLKEYDYYLSGTDEEIFVDIPADPKDGLGQNEVDLNGNVNNSNENEKALESEPNDIPPTSIYSDGSEINIPPSDTPGASFNYSNENPIVQPSVNSDEIICDEGNFDSPPDLETSDEIEEILPTGNNINTGGLINSAVSMEPAEVIVKSNFDPMPMAVENPDSPERIPKNIYEDEFENLQADDSDEDTGEIEKPKTFETPKGIIFYELVGFNIRCIYHREFGKRFYEKSSFDIDFTFLPFPSNFSSLSFASDHKKIAFALIGDRPRGKPAPSKIIVKDLEQMSTLEICDGEGNNCYDPHISPDGKLVIYRKGDWKTLYYYNIETGIETKLDLPPNSFKHEPKFFADGKRFVFVALINRKFKIIVSNIFNTQKKTKCIYESDSFPRQLAVSPNGRYIAFHLNYLIHVAAVNDKERLDKNFKFDMPIPSVIDATLSNYYSSIERRQIIEMQKFFRPFWSPDSMVLFFSTGRTKLYYTGYGLDKWQIFDASSEKKIYGIISDVPVMKAEELVKSALDDIVDQVVELN
jgi:Tol biopolymer transport system component